MKKTFLALSALALLAVSCKKDYNCTCNKTFSMPTLYWSSDSILYSNSYVLDEGTTVYTFKVKKKESEDKCKSFESTSTQNDYYGSTFYGDDPVTATKCSLSEK
ncbi:MAG: hypothetical protein HYU67_10330 [Flavobacteriia bacterium]|nr:hypothetical protein [Flavobacteriia bacterium]